MKKGTWRSIGESVATFTLPFGCGDPAPISRSCLSVNLSAAARGEILLEGMSIRRSVNYTGPSLNLIQRNVPQNNVTGSNKSNIVTVTVFGNLYEENKDHRYTGTLFSARKIVSAIGQKLKLTECLWWKNNLHDGQPSWPRLQWTFPQTAASIPASDIVRQLPLYWWRLCNYVI